MLAFVLLSWLGVFIASGVGWALRSRLYGIFRLVGLSLHTLMATAMYPRLAWAGPLFLFLHTSVYLHSLVLIRPRLRPFWYRALVSIPSAWFGAGTLLSLPYALVALAGFDLPWPWLPYTLALVGVIQSLTMREEEVDVALADGSVNGLQRHTSGPARVARPLRVVQITDPHLGPFMSVERLRSIAISAVRRNPDLIVLTGDFLTMESQADPELLGSALQPLLGLPGKVFACLGNHDHEALAHVRQGLASAGVQLLVDEATVIETPAGPVQIVGADFAFRDRAQHLVSLCESHPRIPGALRLLLLHDPTVFKHLPEGDADLVLSGHTHGGQVGLVSLGLPWTLMRLFVKAPDHGLWARGTDRLYVHRGTGHYGFPLRLGVPAENSVLSIHAPWLTPTPENA